MNKSQADFFIKELVLVEHCLLRNSLVQSKSKNRKEKKQINLFCK